MHDILQQLSQLRKGKQSATDQREVDIFTSGASTPQTVIATQPPLEPAERIGNTLVQARNIHLTFLFFVVTIQRDGFFDVSNIVVLLDHQMLNYCL